MTLADVAIFAVTEGANSAEAPDSGIGFGLIAAVVVGVVVMAVLLFTIFHRMSRATKGGVVPDQDELRRGNPPFEGVQRHR